MVGHVVVQIQERQQRAQEALSLPGRQAKHQAQGDRRLDGVVRVLALSAWLPARRPRRVPVGELAIGESEPDGQTPASAETRLVLPPIPDTVGLLDVLPLGALETRHAGPRISGWRAIIDRDRELCTKASFRPSPPVGGRPVVTYNDALTFHLNGEEVRAFLAPPAHTDGDTFVYFPDSDGLHLGDVFRTTTYPIIGTYNGGTLAGTIEALEMAIDMAGPATRVIPGHGLSVVGQDEMQEFLDMILDVRARVLTSIEDGMTLDEVMAARPTAMYDATWSQDAGWTAEDFVPIVYYELGGSGRLTDR